FSGGGAKVQISPDGGTDAGWTHDGRQIVYRTGERGRTFVAVDVRTEGDVSISPPRVLFTTDWELGTLNHEVREWDRSRDGRERFGIRRVTREEPDRRIELVTSGTADRN